MSNNGVSKYVAWFTAHNGPGPYACHFCDEKLTFDDLHIHHISGDHSDNAIENLAATHKKCHHGHHMRLTNSRRSPEERRALALHANASMTPEQKFARSRKGGLTAAGKWEE